MISDPNAELCFQDEVHFMTQSTITRSWYKKGSKPRIKSYPGRKAVAYSGFITPSNGVLFTTKPEWFNYQTTIQCIRDYINTIENPCNKKNYLIMDNAPWHKKAKRLILDEKNAEYADIRQAVTFISLPPYSPDLNPIEQVWRVTRHEKTHNKYWSSINDITSVLDGWFHQFLKPNNKLKSLCKFLWN